jgi:hypothetical protein
MFGTWGPDREGDERSRRVTGVTVIGVRDHFVAVEAHVVRGQREADVAFAPKRYLFGAPYMVTTAPKWGSLGVLRDPLRSRR